MNPVDSDPAKFKRALPSPVRIITILLMFFATFAGMHRVERIEPVPIKKSLAQFPDRIGHWVRIRERALPEKVAGMLGVDEYIDCDYRGPDGAVLSLYVSYYAAVGLTGIYHSPRNCLPGGGWQVADVGRIVIENAGIGGASPIEVNSFDLRKGNESSRFIYWFQNRGRIIASEYWEKIYAVWDALFMRRRDGTFVRIHVIPGNPERFQADAGVENFVLQVIRTLEEFLPGGKPS